VAEGVGDLEELEDVDEEYVAATGARDITMAETLSATSNATETQTGALATNDWSASATTLVSV
jgi:hypothetical protein